MLARLFPALGAGGESAEAGVAAAKTTEMTAAAPTSAVQRVLFTRESFVLGQHRNGFDSDNTDRAMYRPGRWNVRVG
jgi:hypothetical protein